MLNNKEVDELNKKTNEVENVFEKWNREKTIGNYVKWLQKIYENFSKK